MNEEEVKIEETIPEGAENAEKEFSDDVYRLQEMTDEMSKSIDNIKSVKAEQEYLVGKLVELNDEKFKKLITELVSQDKSLEKQIDVITARQQLLTKVCEKCNNAEIREVVNMLLAGLGVFAE